MSEQDTLAKRFHEGLCLAAGGEFERAGAAFLDCVVADPGCGEFVQEFLANLTRRFPCGKQPPSLPKGEMEDSLKRAVAQGNWAEVLRHGPRLFANHPWHVPTLLALADACEAQGHGEAEACYLTAAIQAAGDDVPVHRRAGQAFARLRKYDEALACWRQVESRNHDDEEASRLSATLIIAASRQRAGLQDPDAARAGLAQGKPARRRSEPLTRFVIGNVDTLTQSAAQLPGLSLTPIQQLEAAIRERPSIPELYLRLAQVYLDKERDYDAERLLAKGREATDRDARVQQMWEDVTMLRHQRRVEIAQREVQAADPPSLDNARATLVQATKERDRIEMEIFLARCKREPDSARSHYELGLRLKRAEKLRDAGQHFEKALADNRQRSSAALELGHCLEKLGEFPQALRNYRLAAEAATSPDQTEEKKESLYRAGKLALRIKLARLAQRYLAQLLRIDPSHRDAAVLMQCT